ncbi:ArsR family transcriptional regulator [Leptolyngbya sp. 15MV]|nr:ArsR family transcriptional regulator [Leptolyngbya sp. 15MV]
MKEGPPIASVAALLGDPARANMLTALMDGRALTATELALAAGVTPQTASGHLARLRAARLLEVDQQGRHRYFRLSGTDVAQVLEALMGLAQRTGMARVRTGPRDEELRAARRCYDHLAGTKGVALFDGLKRRNFITADDEPCLTDHGRIALTEFGIDIAAIQHARRPVCRACLDWSERRHHLGGGLGAAILQVMIGRGWIIDVSFVLFMAQAVEYLGRDATGVSPSIEPGGVLSDRIPPTASDVRVRTPEGVIEPVGQPGPDGRVVFGPVSRAGVYQLSWVGPPGPTDATVDTRSVRPFTANLLDAAESDVAAAVALELPTTVAAAQAEEARRAESPLWPWLVLGMLALLLLEWYVYNRKVHL